MGSSEAIEERSSPEYGLIFATSYFRMTLISSRHNKAIPI